MGTLFISLLTLVLLLISAFVILIVLMQRTSQSGGMGAALGGGAAESAFGADTNNILTKGTIYGIIAFFLVSLGLYLIYQAQAADRMETVDAQSLITADEAEPGAADAPLGGFVEEAAAEAEGTIESISESAEGAAASTEAAAEDLMQSMENSAAPETAPAASN